MKMHSTAPQEKVLRTLRATASLVVAAAMAMGAPGIARAQSTQPSSRPEATMLDQLPLVSLSVGRSRVISSPVPIKRVSVTDPKIADIQVITPTQVLVSGKGVGATDLILWGQNEEAHAVPISVGVDQVAIRNELANLLPNCKLDVRLSNNVIIVSGELHRTDEAESLHRFLDVSGLKYVDMTTQPGVRQVQIKVVLAEASRTAIRALGINAAYSDGKSFAATNQELNQFSLKQDPNGLSVFADQPPTSAVTMFGRAAVGSTLMEGFTSALVDNQYARVLAEPNLVANSDQDASFLAGGEIPIPIVQTAAGTGGNTSVTIEWKEFGVRLHFRPTVMGENKIRLHVAPEVSDISEGPGSIQVSGFSIPAINTRRAETTLEMSSGQTFAMAGLISQSTQSRSQSVPWLGEVPVLGALFRSVRYQRGDTELLLLVTASLVQPESWASRPAYPGITHVAPNDWELYALGRIEGARPAKVSPSEARWLQEAGLSKLRGPGAWTTYESEPAEAEPDMDSTPAPSATTQPAQP